MIYDQFSWASKLPEDTSSPSPDIFIEKGLLASLHGTNMKKSRKSNCVLKESYALPSVGSLQACITLNIQSSILGHGTSLREMLPFCLLPTSSLLKQKALQNKIPACWPDLH